MSTPHKVFPFASTVAPDIRIQWMKDSAQAILEAMAELEDKLATGEMTIADRNGYLLHATGQANDIVKLSFTIRKDR